MLLTVMSTNEQINADWLQLRLILTFALDLNDNNRKIALDLNWSKVVVLSTMKLRSSQKQQLIQSKEQVHSKHQLHRAITSPSQQYQSHPRIENSKKLHPSSSHRALMKVQPWQFNIVNEKLQQIEAKVSEVKGNMHRRFLQRKKLQTKRKQELEQLRRNKLAHRQRANNTKSTPKQEYAMDEQPNQRKSQSEPSNCSSISSIKQVENKELQKIHNVGTNLVRIQPTNNQVQPIHLQPNNSQSSSPFSLQDLIFQQKPTPVIKPEQQLVKMQKTLHGLVTTIPQPHHHSHIFVNNPYSSRSNVYYVSEVLKGHLDPKSVVHEHVKTSIHLFNYFASMRIPSSEDVSKRMVSLPHDSKYLNKKTIIFDLDQTLIHCNQNLSIPHEVVLPITFPNGEVIKAGLNIRPGAREILEALHQQFQLIVFTASHYCYANVVIDYLDPKKQYIQHRLYRQHCFLTKNGQYVKDLRIINRELKNMVLIDNAAYSYAFQPENGIPIIPYYHGQKDYELDMLTHYIQKLQSCEDVRVKNREIFKLTRYRDYKTDMVSKLVEDLYGNKN